MLTFHRLKRDSRYGGDQKFLPSSSKMATTTKRVMGSKLKPLALKSSVGGRRSRLRVFASADQQEFTPLWFWCPGGVCCWMANQRTNTLIAFASSTMLIRLFFLQSERWLVSLVLYPLRVVLPLPHRVTNPVAPSERSPKNHHPESVCALPRLNPPFIIP